MKSLESRPQVNKILVTLTRLFLQTVSLRRYLDLTRKLLKNKHLVGVSYQSVVEEEEDLLTGKNVFVQRFDQINRVYLGYWNLFQHLVEVGSMLAKS